MQCNDNNNNIIDQERTEHVEQFTENTEGLKNCDHHENKKEKRHSKL